MSTHNIPIFNIKKRKSSYIFLNLQLFFPRNSKNEFKTAEVNEPSVFEPLKFYCTLKENKWLLSFRNLPQLRRKAKIKMAAC